MRRLPILLLMLLILAAACWMLYGWEGRKAAAPDPWKAVPEQSAIIISIPDAWNTWDRFTHTSLLWEAFEQLPSFAAAGRLMTGTVERMQNDAALRQALEKADVLVAVLRDGLEVGGLFIGDPKGGGRSPLTSYAELMGLDAAARDLLARGEVVQVRPDTALPALSICMREGTWLMATSPAIMEASLFQMKSGRSILHDQIAARVQETMGGGTDGNMLIHPGRTARLAGRWLNSEVIEEVQVPDGWVAMDLRSRPDALLMSGLIATRDEETGFTSLGTQGTGRLAVTRVLPARVIAIDARNISDPRQYLENEHAQHPGDLAAGLFHWVNGSMGRAWAQEHGITWRWAFFQAGDPEQAQQAIRSLCTAEAVCDQQEYRGILLQRTPGPNMLPELLGSAWSAFERPWWILLGDVILFSDNVEALRSSIDAWNDGNSLAEEPRFTAWAQRISTSSGRLVWCDLARANGFVRDHLRTGDQKQWDGALAFWNRIGGLSLQLSPGQRGFHHVVAGVQHAPLEQQDNGVLWETEVGALVQRRPAIIRNHNNNSNEVLVQDVDNKIHLIGSTGKVLWSRQLDGAIMGRVHQVDRFKNGRLQLLFNTAGMIHLIDRNGRDVGDFPVRIREGAVQPLAVMDYENDREYRVLLPTTGGRILNYALDGKEVKGWEKPHLKATAACPVHHLRIKNKDYLILADQLGKMHILDRRGVVREKTVLDLGEAPGVEHILPGAEIMGSSIIWRNGEGVVQQAFLHGSIIPFSPEGSPGSHRSIDIDGDGTFESLTFHGDSLIVGRGGRPVYMRTYGTGLDEDVQVHAIGKRRKALSLVTPAFEKVSLLDDSGRDLPGLPVRGVVPPAVSDLNLDDIPELITVTSDGRVIAYSLHRLGQNN